MKTSRGLLHTEKPTTVTSQAVAVDEFGELPERKRAATKRALGLGHVLGPWHRRPNDVAGRFNAFCRSCNRIAVVCIETPDGLDDIYGTALVETCRLTPAQRRAEQAADERDARRQMNQRPNEPAPIARKDFCAYSKYSTHRFVVANGTICCEFCGKRESECR